MLKNYHIVLLRTLRKHKGYAAINMLGLALGMACCTFILLYVQHERSFDRFHTNQERVYRVNKVVTSQDGGTELHALTAGLLAPALTATFPEVEQAVRLLPWFNDVLLVHGEQSIMVSDVVIADSNFFDVFSFDLVRGDPGTVLRAPMSMVLTETTAQALFGTVDPIGQSIVGLNNLTYTVTGIAADPPATSHLAFEALLSWSSSLPGSETLNFAWMNRWITQAPFTYLLLAPHADAAALGAKLPAFYAQQDPDRAAQYHLYLQALGEIYLGSGDLLYTGNTRRGALTYVYIFSSIALLILVVAGINFVNLSTARAAKRAKEVGVRKVLGADRWQLGLQFLGESVLYSVMACVLALALVELAAPAFQAFTGKPLPSTLAQQPLLVVFLLGLAFGIGALAGAYPAAVLSGFTPTQALKGQVQTPSRAITPRRVLVATQFAISIMLVAATAVVFQQMDYMQSRNLGFAQDQIIVLHTDDTAMQSQLAAFKTEVLKHPSVLQAAGSSNVPGSGSITFGLAPEGAADDENWTANVVRVDDYDLAATYELAMTAGRYFSPDHATDATEGVVINEALARSLGWDDPVGKRLDIIGELNPGTVIGVVKDFHYQSLHHAIEPLAFYFAPRGHNLSVRVALDDLPGTLAYLQSTWERFDATYPFLYTFLDQRFAQFYATEQRLMQTLSLFAILATVIACLGLFGLASFMAEQRTKEVGVRKMLGASVGQVVRLFIQEYVGLVLVALLVAAPLTYLGARRWLQDFAYQVDLGPGLFIMAGGVTLSIALLTVAYQSIRAALADPVNALRYE